MPSYSATILRLYCDQIDEILFLKTLFVAFAGVVFSASCAVAQTVEQKSLKVSRYPERPVRVVVPVAAGGGTDIIAHLTVTRLSEVMGQSFVVDNRPGALNVALATPSSSGALAAELFKILTQTRMVSVPFKGGAPALTALLGGEVQLIFTTPPTVMPVIKSGRVKILSTSGRERVPYLPDVPTLAEAGVKEMETAPWQGLLGPANLPQATIDTLHTQIRSVLKLIETRERFAAAGTDAVGNTPAEFARMIQRELVQNKRVIDAVGMRAD